MKTFFEIEKERARLAEKHDFKNLKKLYSSKFPELKDENTGKFWNSLNAEHKTGKKFSPMEYDKLTTAGALIEGEESKILNIGFGSGNFEELYFTDHKEWHGIDIAPESVKMAQKKFPHGHFTNGTILELPYRDNYFDYVLSFEVLEHIRPSQIHTALSEVYRVLRPRGKFIASVPINEGLEKMVKNHLNPNSHMRDYTANLIKAELEINHFAVEYIKTFYAFNSYYFVKTMIARITRREEINGVLIMSKKEV